MRKPWNHLIVASLFVFVTFASQADEASRYDELLKSPAVANTVKSLGTAFLALSTERDKIEPQIKGVWWANNPLLEINDARREVENASLHLALDDVEKAIEKRRLNRLVLAGATPYGTVNNLDLYFAGESDMGPILIRVAVYFPKDRGALLFEIDLFEGFSECRAVIGQIEHTAGKRIFSVDVDQNQRQPNGAAGNQN